MITSPLMGLAFELDLNGNQAQLCLQHCDQDLVPGLVKIEKELALLKVESITLTLADALLAQQQRVKDLFYDLCDEVSNSVFYKKISHRPSVRFSLTEKCNYHCFFCHEEGMDMTTKREAADTSQLFKVIDQCKELDYQDFTFTGGEPLLQWRTLEACLAHMEQQAYLPDITIVTNGDRISERILTRLNDYPGKVRFNISMHSLDDSNYLDIVHRKKDKPADPMQLDKIKDKIALVKQSGIPFKLNFVLLKGLNTAPESILAILDYGVSCGATSVKFLELLITEDLQRFYPYFYRIESLYHDIKEVLTPISQGIKRKEYRYLDTDLIVELQHCTCASPLGCNGCAINRDANFTAELNYFPCFLNPNKNYPLTEMTFSEALAQGDTYIEAMAAKFKDDSPILIKNAPVVSSAKAWFYEINKQDVASLLALLKAEKHRVRQLQETYFTNNEPAMNRFESVIKIYANSYDSPSQWTQVKQQVTVLPQGAIETRFVAEPELVNDLSLYQAQLSQAGYQPHHTLSWTIEYFYSAQGEVSVSQNHENDRYIVRSTSALNFISPTLTLLTENIPYYLSHKL